MDRRRFLRQFGLGAAAVLASPLDPLHGLVREPWRPGAKTYFDLGAGPRFGREFVVIRTDIDAQGRIVRVVELPTAYDGRTLVITNRSFDRVVVTSEAGLSHPSQRLYLDKRESVCVERRSEVWYSVTDKNLPMVEITDAWMKIEE